MDTPSQIRIYITLSIIVFLGFSILVLNLLVNIMKKRAVLKKLHQSVVDYSKQLEEANKVIEEHKNNLEKMLEERTEELVLSERQAAFGQLIQGIVHNLNNPLSSIYGCIQMVQYSLDQFRSVGEGKVSKMTTEDNFKSIEHMTNLINSSAEKMSHMIKSMMAKSRSDKSDELEICDLNSIIQNESTFMEADQRLKYNIVISFDYCKDDLTLEVVPSEIAQIYQNLVQNSADALYGQRNAKINVATKLEGEYAVFSVSDNGSGIPPEIISKLFDPFFTTKPKASEEVQNGPVGTGLGLYTCLKTIKSYDGTIEVDSESDKGTTFTVYVPLRKEKAV